MELVALVEMSYACERCESTNDHDQSPIYAIRNLMPISPSSPLESAHTSGVYPKRPLAIVRGLGARAWDAEGREYIDCVGGQGAANLGHAHPDIVAAISRQAATLISCPEIFYNDQRAHFWRAGRGRAGRAWSGASSATPARRPTRPRSSSPA